MKHISCEQKGNTNNTNKYNKLRYNYKSPDKAKKHNLAHNSNYVLSLKCLNSFLLFKISNFSVLCFELTYLFKFLDMFKLYFFLELIFSTIKCNYILYDNTLYYTCITLKYFKEIKRDKNFFE